MKDFSTSRKLYILHNYSHIFYTSNLKGSYGATSNAFSQIPKLGAPILNIIKNSANSNKHLPSWHQATLPQVLCTGGYPAFSPHHTPFPTRFCASLTGLPKCGLLPGDFSTLHSGTYCSLVAAAKSLVTVRDSVRP